MAHDALGAHARDELGITETLSARPLQAALASACSFAVGAALPLLVTALAPAAHLIPFVSGSSLACLALLGGVAARVGGAQVGRRPARHLLGGAGHGAHCRRRGALRHRGVTAGPWGAPLRHPRTRHAPAGFQKRWAPGVQGPE